MQKNLKIIIIPTFLSLVGSIIALFPSNPINLTLPSRDSGVFLYVGWRLINGDIPYRDVWDHKPPLIYFVDALGLILSPQSLWGVWLLGFLFLFLTIFFLYKSLYDSLGTLPAIIGSSAAPTMSERITTEPGTGTVGNWAGEKSSYT